MMIRPDELTGIKNGAIDLAFRRWDRARVKSGTQMRTAVGLIEVTDVEALPLSALRADDARRAGARSLTALRDALSKNRAGTLFRIGLRYAGPDPRDELRTTIPDQAEIATLHAWLAKLDSSSTSGPWTRATLEIIDRSPGVRAPDLAAELGRPTQDFKTDVRKLKEKGLTESLAIGYQLSPRGESVLDALDPTRPRPARAPMPDGTPLPRSIGAPATRALREHGVTTMEQVLTWTPDELRALHGVGPVAVARLRDRLGELGLSGPFTSDHD